MNKLKGLTLNQARILRESLIMTKLSKPSMIGNDLGDIEYLLSQVNDIIDNLLQLGTHKYDDDYCPF